MHTIEWVHWLWSIGALTGVITLAGAIVTLAGKTWFTSWITKSIEHDFAEKLEKVRADLRISEEEFKAKLAEKSQEIKALRDSPLSVMAARQIANDKRRLEVVDAIWTSYMSLEQIRISIRSMTIGDIASEFRYALAGEGNYRQYIKVFVEDIDEDKLSIPLAASTGRVHLTENSWDYYFASTSLTAQFVMYAKCMSEGDDVPFVTSQKLLDLVTKFAPNLIDDVTRNGLNSCGRVITELEMLLLNELKKRTKRR